MVCMHKIRVGINSVCISGHYQHPNQRLIQLFDTSGIWACVQVFVFMWCFWTLVRSSLIKSSLFLFLQCRTVSVHQLNASNVNVTAKENNATMHIVQSQNHIQTTDDECKLDFLNEHASFYYRASVRQMLCPDWGECNEKEKTKLQTQWHVIEFDTLERVHLWYWWLNLSLCPI